MATQALSSSALSPHIDDDHYAGATTMTAASQPSLLRRIYDAFTASQLRRAQREVDRMLGAGAFRRALQAQLPPEH